MCYLASMSDDHTEPRAGTTPPTDVPPSLYDLIGVAPGASRQAIVHAYRQQARASHPDANPGDAGAGARFRSLTSAYEVLSDPLRRSAYDRARAVNTSSADGGLPSNGWPNGIPRPVLRPQAIFLNANGGQPMDAPLSVGPVWAEPPAPVEQGVHSRREVAALVSYLLGIADGWWSA